MKINGRKIEGPNVEIIVLPRGDGEDIVFKAQAVLDFEPFRQLCPAPTPPTMIQRGVGRVADVENKVYKKQVEDHNQRRTDWIIITSLRATEGLEWEKVQYNDPTTWHLYKDELKESGFGELEINRIFNGILTANSLNEDKMEEARKRFLLGQAKMSPNSSSPLSEQTNTQSGELVNGSA